MAHDSLLPPLSVAELLKQHPCVVSVFMRHRMACVGCAIADFHTVAQAAALYELDEAQFVSELESAIQNSSQKDFVTMENCNE